MKRNFKNHTVQENSWMVITTLCFNKTIIHILLIALQTLSVLIGTAKDCMELSLISCMCMALDWCHWPRIHENLWEVQHEKEKNYKACCYRYFYIIKGIIKMHNRRRQYNWFRISRAFWKISSFEDIKQWEGMMHSHVMD